MLPKQTAERYLLSSSPHAHGPRTVSSLMLDVIVALLPAFGCAVFFFGLRALLLAGTSSRPASSPRRSAALR